MDPRWIALVLCLPMIAGCLGDDGARDPKEGDLELRISASDIAFPPGGSNLSLTMTLRNVGGDDVLIDDSFYFGSTLFPSVHAANGTEVEISYPQVDREPHYSALSPGEVRNVTEIMDSASLVVNGTRQSFDWDVPGSYKISVSWRGARGSDIEIESNEIAIEIGDYLSPASWDLSFKISLSEVKYPTDAEELDLTMELENVCDHPVMVQMDFMIGYTIFGRADSSNGSKIVFFPGFYPDYEPLFGPLYPGRSLVIVQDLKECSYLEEVGGPRFEWDARGMYEISMYWAGVKDSPVKVDSNTALVLIV
jgi:hypothetical protein